MLLEASVTRLRRLRSSREDANKLAAAVAPSVSPPTPVPVQQCTPTSAPSSRISTPDGADAAHVRARRRARRIESSVAPARVPRLSRRSRIISGPNELTHVMSALPQRFQTRDLQCAYSTADDGIALCTLYARAAGVDPALLLVRDAGGATFGCFTVVPFAATPGGRYAGSGETFVFSMRPEQAVYQWTRSDRFFHLCDSEKLAVGGGGNFALFLDEMLEHGASGASTTFGNKCLASDTSFEAVVVELWKLVVPCRWKRDVEDLVH